MNTNHIQITWNTQTLDKQIHWIIQTIVVLEIK